MFRKLSVRMKLLALQAFAALMLCITGGLAIIYLGKVVNTFSHITDVTIPDLHAINESRNRQRDIVILVSNITMTNKALPDADKLKAEYQTATDAYTKATETYEAIPPSPGEEKLRASVDKAWIEFEKIARQITMTSDSSAPTDLQNRAQLSENKLPAARTQFKSSFKALMEFHEDAANQAAGQAKNTATTAKEVVTLAILLGCIAVLSFGYRASTILSKTLSLITQKISRASDTTVSTSQQISAASTQLAASSTEQASSLQQTAASMEEISTTVGKNADSAKKTASIAEDSQRLAVEGQRVVSDVVTSIDNIRQSNDSMSAQFDSNNKEMAQIIKVIHEIETNTKVINDIVFQTRLLSFNASVEAARAGEHGKGFAVVAEEVGKLAQMSGNAAQSIAKILQEGIQRVENIVNQSGAQITRLLTENKDKVKTGTEVAQKCRHVLDQLADNVNQTKDMAGSIARASQEQSQGVKEVNSAISQLEDVLQQTNSASQNLSSASHSLTEQTDILNGIVHELFSVVNGQSSNANTRDDQSHLHPSDLSENAKAA